MLQACRNIKITDAHYCFSRALFVALFLASQNAVRLTLPQHPAALFKLLSINITIFYQNSTPI